MIMRSRHGGADRIQWSEPRPTDHRGAPAGTLAGWAATIRGEMTPYSRAGRDPRKMEACARLTPGSVSVWAGAGEGVCFFGELIATGMVERGCVGAVADGGVRDLSRLRRLGLPVYARYRTPVQSIGRWRVTDDGAPVSLPGATTPTVEIRPGDFALGDEDGVVVVPAGVASEVLERAEQLGAREAQIRAELEQGLALADALARFGHV